MINLFDFSADSVLSRQICVYILYNKIGRSWLIAFNLSPHCNRFLPRVRNLGHPEIKSLDVLVSAGNFLAEAAALNERFELL